MTEFPSNSKNSQTTPQTQERVVEAVVSSEATSRKKPLGRRLREVLIGGDTKSVINYVFSDVLMPQAKEMFVEAVSSGFEKLIYGEARSSRRYGGQGRPQTGPGPTNYTRYAVRGNNPIGRQTQESRRPNASIRTQEIDDILLATRVEAELVVDRLYDLLRDYETVTVADLRSLLNWTSDYTDRKWGWTDLSGTDVRRVRDGYILVLPKPIALD